MEIPIWFKMYLLSVLVSFVMAFTLPYPLSYVFVIPTIMVLNFLGLEWQDEKRVVG
jgi:hypothetical protein